MRFLVDTGSTNSVIAKCNLPYLRTHLQNNFTLIAANDTKITVFAYKNLKFKINYLQSHHRFFIANIKQNILGSDFFSRFKIDISFKHGHLIHNNRTLFSFIDFTKNTKQQKFKTDWTSLKKLMTLFLLLMYLTLRILTIHLSILIVLP